MYIAVGGVLLGSGLFLYEKAPVVSVVAITIGLFGSLLLTLGVLSKINEK